MYVHGRVRILHKNDYDYHVIFEHHVIFVDHYAHYTNDNYHKRG